MNLLTDPVFRAITPAGPTQLSLPGLLAALGEDGIETLPGLQRHQEDIFHVFLCYLAGAVLARTDRNEPRQNEDFWRDGLRQLAGNAADDAFTLVVADPAQPAFLQPPAPSAAVFKKDYKPKASTPDALDVLQAAKNHDVKASRGGGPDPEGWCYALVGLQTASGFLGKGNYGIARMNGGFGSRIVVSWRTDRRPGTRFLRDTRILLGERQKLLNPPYLYRENGLVLLWLEPWDGKDSLSLSRLDPFFTEVARRVRLVNDGGKISALGAPANAARLAAKDYNGNVGDPWTPINESKNSALTPSTAGLTPKLMRDLLFADGYRLFPLQLPRGDEGAGWFCASVLIRGKGTTDGFHEAVIRVPERARPFVFGKGAERDRLADFSKKGLELAGYIQSKALWPALFSLLEGGPESINFDAREVKQWVNSAIEPFVGSWHSLFFDWLWTTLDETDETAALRPWFQTLRGLAWETLEQSISRTPTRTGRGWRARTQAEGMFNGSLLKNFMQFMEDNR